MSLRDYGVYVGCGIVLAFVIGTIVVMAIASHYFDKRQAALTRRIAEVEQRKSQTWDGVIRD